MKIVIGIVRSVDLHQLNWNQKVVPKGTVLVQLIEWKINYNFPKLS